MAGSKYTDTISAIQIIGCLLKQPSLLNNEGKYFFSEDDFVNDFHKIVFGSIFNLHQMGANKINTKAIEDYLNDRPQSLGVYKANHGTEWLRTAEEQAELENFDYNYNKLKKLTLLREYDKIGVDVSWIYDPNEIFDVKKRQQQENYLDSLSLTQVADLIDDKILNIRRTYIDNSIDEAIEIGDGLEELILSLQQTPEMGLPMYGSLINTITRGMRAGKFYLRSAASGVGKSRMMIADACSCACDRIWKNGKWYQNGIQMPSVLISTELELDEIQTMCIAFLSGVNEDHILYGTLEYEEKPRVQEAIKVLKEAPLYIEIVPDFSLRDIENIIKRNIRTRGVKYFFYDYIHTSLKILEEISSRSGGVRLREDNILFLLGVKLKDICNQFGVFIISSTQLNGDWKTSQIPDQNLLRGAKSLADKIDWGSIVLDVTEEDREKLQTLVDNKSFVMPNIKMSVYKNRRGSYNKCFLWMHADKSICRFDGLFVTNYSYELIPIREVDIEIAQGYLQGKEVSE